MAEGKRISKLVSELGVGVNTLAKFLAEQGYNEDVTPNTKVPAAEGIINTETGKLTHRLVKIKRV